MYVTGFEIAGFGPSSPDGPNSGTVVLLARGARMQIPLTVQRRIEIEKSRDRLLLLATALRQARRIPEYRRRGRMKFAPGVLPRELTRA